MAHDIVLGFNVQCGSPESPGLDNKPTEKPEFVFSWAWADSKEILEVRVPLKPQDKTADGDNAGKAGSGDDTQQVAAKLSAAIKKVVPKEHADDIHVVTDKGGPGNTKAKVIVEDGLHVNWGIYEAKINPKVFWVDKGGDKPKKLGCVAPPDPTGPGFYEDSSWKGQPIPPYGKKHRPWTEGKEWWPARMRGRVSATFIDVALARSWPDPVLAPVEPGWDWRRPSRSQGSGSRALDPERGADALPFVDWRHATFPYVATATRQLAEIARALREIGVRAQLHRDELVVLPEPWSVRVLCLSTPSGWHGPWPWIMSLEDGEFASVPAVRPLGSRGFVAWPFDAPTLALPPLDVQAAAAALEIRSSQG